MSAHSNDPHHDILPLADEFARIATGPGTAVSRVEALMDRLRRAIRFDASFVTLRRPARREYSPLLRDGYDARACAYLDSTSFADDVDVLGLDHRRPPLRVCDFPVPREEVPAWVDFFASAGFREGIKVSLFTPDGRHLGVLGMHSESAVPATDSTLTLLRTIAPLIAHLVDPWRSAAAAALAVRDGVAGAVLTSTGTALPLPGLGGHPLLVTGSAVLRAATGQLADGAVVASFLCPAPATGGPDSHLRVTVLPAPPDPPGGFTAVVVVSRPGDLHGLTRRELEVLGLLVEGRANHSMAGTLGITERTVAAHVDHILTKLAMPSRTAAAVAALGNGWFVPRLLHGVPPPGDQAAR